MTAAAAARQAILRRPTIMDYLATQFETFDERPLGDVDSLVLACIGYYDLPEGGLPEASTREGVPIASLWRAEWFDTIAKGLWDPQGLVRLLGAIVASPRFRDIRFANYVSEFDESAEKQFAACTLLLPTGDAYVSFRGTDNSLVGWKEDFNMAFEKSVPSQQRAVRYLEDVAAATTGRLYVGGHSKGGNLASYAAVMCNDATRARLVRAFSHDGPGFTSETLSSDSWRRSEGLISKTVPKSSMIGMTFERQGIYRLVNSTSVGIMQHDPFSWVVEGTEFSWAEDMNAGAGFLDEGVNQWIVSMTSDERRQFVDALFSVLYASGEDTFANITCNWVTAVPAMLDRASRLDGAQRTVIVRAIALLARAMVPDMPELPESPLAKLRLGGDEEGVTGEATC